MPLPHCRALADDQPDTFWDIETVTAYRCPECGDLHDSRDSARECCETLPQTNDWNRCPVCSVKHYTPYGAADCCLWRDLSPMQRWQLADEVVKRRSWKDAMRALGLCQQNGGNDKAERSS